MTRMYPAIPDLPFHARFAGLDWSADLPLDQFDPAPAAMPRAISVFRQSASAMESPDRTVGRAQIGADGVRFDCGDEVSFELQGMDRIRWMPGTDWRGRLPVSFFSSVAAITLASRGILPLHASTVVLDGKAWLIAGNAGAGKSTLAAELLSAGAQLLADDLTPLLPGPQPLVWRGRPAMRLHPETCAGVIQSAPPQPTDDGRGKLLVRPAARAADQAWPVGGILLLGNADRETLNGSEAAIGFGAILFRPRIVSALPGRVQLRKGLLELARTIPMALIPPVSGFDAASRSARIEATLGAISRLTARASKL